MDVIVWHELWIGNLSWSESWGLSKDTYECRMWYSKLILAFMFEGADMCVLFSPNVVYDNV